MLLFFSICLILANLANAVEIVKNNSVSIYVPAVERTETGYRGVLARLETIVRPGSGHVFIDTFPLTEIDTQSSARIAKEAVKETLGIALEDVDVYFIIRSDSPIVGGPSAGAAMATSLLAALLNLSINQSVIMTGTINLDGSIGPVGGLLEKAQAAAAGGVGLFLIPKGQRIIYEQRTEKEKLPLGIEIITSHPVRIDLVTYAKENWGLDVVEVENVREALAYFTGYEIKTHKVTLGENIELKNAMRELSNGFLREVRRELERVEQNLSNVFLSLREKRLVESLVQNAAEELDTAKKLFDSGLYYSASSRTFVALINCYYAMGLLDLYTARDASQSVERFLKDVSRSLEAAKSRIDELKARIDHVGDIEVIAIASDRISDADTKLREAWKYYYNDELESAIASASYALARVKGSEAWLGLMESFSDVEINFTFSQLAPLAQSLIQDVKSLIAYAESLGIELSRVKSELEIAERAFREKDYATALFKATSIKGEIDATLMTLGIGQEELASKISEAKVAAEVAISEAEGAGAMPILARSYYEYANYLENSTQRFIYYVEAKYYARISKGILLSMGQAVPEEVEVVPSTSIVSPAIIEIRVVAAFALGVFIGMLVAMPKRRRRKR